MFDKQIKAFFDAARQKLREQFKRTLPFGEYVNNRWEKAKFLGFGEGSSIYDSALVFGEVIVGRDVWIGPNTLLDGSGDILSIGDKCHISAGCQIYTHDTIKVVLHDEEKTHAPVNIGSRVYLGPNVVIVKGVNIGNNVVIGANSFINRDIPNNSRAWGTPARLVD
jgi:acetyltransferase-like isoleucine patch superfamily enzyme